MIFFDTRIPEGRKSIGVPSTRASPGTRRSVRNEVKPGGQLKITALATTEILTTSSILSVFDVTFSYSVDLWIAMKWLKPLLILSLQMSEYKRIGEVLRLRFLKLVSWKRAIWFSARKAAISAAFLDKSLKLNCRSLSMAFVSWMLVTESSDEFVRLVSRGFWESVGWAGLV